MSRPRRRYVHVIAARYGVPPSWVRENMSAKEFLECIAYDLTTNEAWLEKYYKQQELEQSKELSDADKSLKIKQIFGL